MGATSSSKVAFTMSRADTYMGHLVPLLLVGLILAACGKSTGSVASSASSPDPLADVYGKWNYAGSGGGHTVVFVPHSGNPRTMSLRKDGDKSITMDGVTTSYTAAYEIRDSAFFQRTKCRFLNDELLETSADGMTLTLSMEAYDGTYDRYERVPTASN